MPVIRVFIVACAAMAVCASVRADAAVTGVTGSLAFCLFRVPGDEPGRQRWINLGMVQYVETARNELRIIYGGGSFGAGHEVRIAYANAEEVFAQLERMRQTAAACR
jgi:hypothetical protein